MRWVFSTTCLVYIVCVSCVVFQRLLKAQGLIAPFGHREKPRTSHPAGTNLTEVEIYARHTSRSLVQRHSHKRLRCQRYDEERVLPRLHIMHNSPSPAHLLVKALLRGVSPSPPRPVFDPRRLVYDVLHTLLNPQHVFTPIRRK